jgi:hypothetical protein
VQLLRLDAADLATLAETTAVHSLLGFRLCHESTIRSGVETVTRRASGATKAWVKYRTRCNGTVNFVIWGAGMIDGLLLR